MTVEIIAFFHNNDDQIGINIDQLILHTKMFHDILEQRRVTVSNLMDVVEFLQGNMSIASLSLELVKLVKLVLIAPISACLPERSFPTLRRLNTSLRSSMTQARLKSKTVIHIHREYSKELSMDELMDEFILKNKVRMHAFAVSGPLEMKR